ncbi:MULTISPECIES: OmpA/MotB family protein [Tepidibacillus]|uniref:OmpA-like domain-containing protein n=1 Tax=Tepidibacillus decaturensis TaxID=1413211 RepID=A0A135L558_9BACI|nr:MULTISPECIES: flagellar motor protein MotB [Tepidibacillus]KXG44070.1 hypothetical protein U473_08665 [Tepidibacillus decaturensis]GBF10456.1 motility protein B [Tepidibacillus sp. HK-1]
MSNRRKKKGEAPENHERWLITYADLITLLMIFFVVMYSMSKLEVQKFDQIAASLSDAFYYSSFVEGTGKNGITGTGDGQQNKLKENIIKNLEDEHQKQLEKGLKDLRKKVEQYIKANHLEDSIEMIELPRGIQISLKEKIFFDLGKAEIKPEARGILDSLAAMFKEIQNPLSIEGHTDNLPIRPGSTYKSNFDLSAARSSSVLHYLIEKHQIKPERLRIVGYGEYQPVYKNDTQEHRQANRRVNIVILRYEYETNEQLGIN